MGSSGGPTSERASGIIFQLPSSRDRSCPEPTNRLNESLAACADEPRDLRSVLRGRRGGGESPCNVRKKYWLDREWCAGRRSADSVGSCSNA